MKTWKHTLLIFVILAVVNNSCSAIPLDKSTPVSPNTPSATIPPVTVTPIATKTPVSQINSSCWTVKPLQAGNVLKGSFLFRHYAPFVEGVGRKMESFFVWDLSSFKSKKLNLDMTAINKSVDEQNLSRVVGSTNGNNFIMVTDHDIIFISQDSAEFIPLPEKESTDTAHLPSNIPAEGWFLINTFGNYENGNIGIEDTYYIFNSNTKEISKHKLFLPDFAKWNQWSGLGIYFSPNMKYVLYRSKSLEGDQFTLYDIVNDKAVWVMPPKDSNLLLIGGDPHWIPNSNLITAEFSNQDTHKSNYYLISIDGKISPLNDLDSSPGTSWGAAINGHTSDWSTDGRYLVSAYPPTYVWDNQAKIWYKPCVPNEEKQDGSLIYHPIWSPDNSFFVATLWFPFLPTPTPGGRFGHNKMYILDVVNKVIYELPESIKPLYDMAEGTVQEEFPTLYKNGMNSFVEWVNWEIP